MVALSKVDDVSNADFQSWLYLVGMGGIVHTVASHTIPRVSVSAFLCGGSMSSLCMRGLDMLGRWMAQSVSVNGCHRLVAYARLTPPLTSWLPGQAPAGPCSPHRRCSKTLFKWSCLSAISRESVRSVITTTKYCGVIYFSLMLR